MLGPSASIVRMCGGKEFVRDFDRGVALEMAPPGGTMKSDQDQIHELVTTWITASRAGDIETLLKRMTDDVIFLAERRCGKTSSHSRQESSQAWAPTIDGSNVDKAYCRGHPTRRWSGSDACRPHAVPPQKGAREGGIGSRCEHVVTSVINRR